MVIQLNPPDDWRGRNYYHFIANWMTRVFLLTGGSRDLRLHYAGPHTAIAQCFTANPIVAERADSSDVSLTWGEVEHASREFPANAKAMARLIMESLGIQPGRSARRVIYIERYEKHARRRLPDNLTRSLADAGVPVEKMAIETLGFAGQVRLMQETALMIGVHGAGLTNAMFMQGGGVVEVLPAYFHFCDDSEIYPTLSRACGIDHTVVHGIPDRKLDVPDDEVASRFRTDARFRRGLRDIERIDADVGEIVGSVRWVLSRRAE